MWQRTPSKTRVGEVREILGVPLDIGDPAGIGGFMLTRVAEHLGRDVDAGDESAEAGK